MTGLPSLLSGLRALLCVSLATGALPARAALSGSLETRFQSDSYFDPGNYLEQWLTLDYRRRDEGVTWGLLGNWGASSDESWMNLHRLFVEKPFFENSLSAKAGRFERIDAAGFYTLDGLEARWQVDSGMRWSIFIGKPGRAGQYVIPHRDEDVNRPDSKYLAGLNLSRALALGGFEQARLSLGACYHFSGVDTMKLDGGFSGNWLPGGDRPPVALNASLVLDTRDGFIESFDVQASLPLDGKSQLWLRGRRYDPPDRSATFADRFYRYYARGWQTVLEAGYRQQMDVPITWGGSLRGIAREQGVEGAGLDLSLDWQLDQGSLLQGRADWLGGDDEHTGGLYLGYQRPLNSRLLLAVNGALRDERSHLDGSRSVMAGEVRLDWMWTRDLHLSGMLELARSRGRPEDYDQLRFGLRLIYQLPARGAEDYR
ncbi:hypothetical protein [Thiolapillus brandeum]|nr:hypothetical protein [Thiolapillus brandeum]